MIIIVVVTVLYLTTTVTAQPTELRIDVEEVVKGSNGFSVPQSIPLNVDETRDIPLPPVGIFDIVCGSSSAFSNPWFYVNSSDQLEAVDIVTGQDQLGSLSPGGIVQYEVQSVEWALRVINFTSDLAGVYECRYDGDIVSVNLIPGNPGIIVEDYEFVRNDGETGLFVSLFILGYPKPNFTEASIFLGDEELSPARYMELGLTKKTPLTFVPVTPKITGLYTVIVSNTEGSANVSFMVKINVKPVISINKSHDEAYIGESFQLICITDDGIPDPSYSWSHNDEVITADNEDYSIEDFPDNSILTLTNVSYSNRGLYRCDAQNVAGKSDFEITISVLLPPPSSPIVTLMTLNDIATVYTGGIAILNCTASLPNPVYNGKTASIYWKRNGTLVNTSLIHLEGDNDVYSNLLTVSVSSAHNGDEYKCMINVFDETVTSNNISSQSLILMVEDPPIEVSVSPKSLDVINLSPYNFVRLNCTASVPISANVHYEWYLNGSLLTNTAKVNITEKGGSSILTDSPTIPGKHSYQCSYVVELSYPDSSLQMSSVATINVQGPVDPNVPVSLEDQILSYNSVNIKFSVSHIAYGREYYYVIYGKNSDNLSMKSSLLSGNLNLDAEDEDFVIHLGHLDHNTVYYYRVVANNTHGFVRTSVRTFQTPKILLIQVKGEPFRGCDNGRVLDMTGVKSFFNEKLSERISEACDCSFPQINLLNGSLYCSAESSNALIYRVYVLPTSDLSSSTVVGHLERSLKSDQHFVSGVAQISIDTSCNISLSSPDDPLCVTEVTTTLEQCDDTTDNQSVLILSGVVIGCFIILLLIILLAMALMLVFQHKRLKRMGIKRTSNQYSVVNCRRETSFIDHRPSPPAIAAPSIPQATQKWEGEVSISDCPAYLYSVKPLDDEPPQTIVERQPTPGIYDSIDGLNSAGFHVVHQASNPLQTKVGDGGNISDSEDFTGSSVS